MEFGQRARCLNGGPNVRQPATPFANPRLTCEQLQGFTLEFGNEGVLPDLMLHEALKTTVARVAACIEHVHGLRAKHGKRIGSNPGVL